MSEIASTTSGTPDVTAHVDYLVDLLSRLPGRQRFILGITGYPAAGKSSISERLAKGVNRRIAGETAAVVPMDGFHYSNDKLQQMGLLELKGIPDTFDALGFVDLLKRLRHGTAEKVYCPLFDRSIEASIEDALIIRRWQRLCIVEGNYLLLDKEPWNKCREYCDEVWFLNTSIETILPRLYARHQQGGRTPESARAKVESTDLPNARLIEPTKQHATRLIECT